MLSCQEWSDNSRVKWFNTWHILKLLQTETKTLECRLEFSLFDGSVYLLDGEQTQSIVISVQAGTFHICEQASYTPICSVASVAPSADVSASSPHHAVLAATTGPALQGSRVHYESQAEPNCAAAPCSGDSDNTVNKLESQGEKTTECSSPHHFQGQRIRFHRN